MTENGFTLERTRSRWYSAPRFITDADYADDITLLAITSVQAESLLLSLERAAKGIGLQMNADKTEYMCFSQRGGSLKLVGKFTHPRSSVSSPENDINTRLAKALTAIEWQLVIWKSDLFDKIKRNFFQAAVVSTLLCGCIRWTLTKAKEKKLNGNCTRMLRAILNKYCRQHPTKQHVYGQLPPISKSSKLDEHGMWNTTGGARTNSWTTFSDVPIHTDAQV